MFLRHSAIYLLSRGVPGLVGFATIIIYTRLLSPEVYGQYALVVSAAVLCNAIFYHWLSASLLRFLPQYRNNEDELLTTILSGFIFVSFLIGIMGTLFLMFWWDTSWVNLIVIGILLVWVQAWFAINLELVRSRLAPIRYGFISMFKSLVAMGLGVALVILDYGAYGALIGLVLGFFLASIWSSWGQWKFLKEWRLNKEITNKVLFYGLPLTISFALTTVISSTDRFMLAGMISESATGLYTAGQGLSQQTVGVLMSMVNLAAYPLILKTLESNGIAAAHVQLRKNAILLFGIGLPIATSFVILSTNISKVFLGKEFQTAGIELMPWFAIATLFAGMRSYYFDLAFYLGKNTRIHMVVMGLAAFLNVLLNLWFIPAYGLLGAVYASVATHSIALVLSAILGVRFFRLPSVYGDFFRILISALVMAAVLFFIPYGEGVLRLVLSLTSGSVVYVICMLALNPGGVREVVVRFLVLGKNVL